MDIPWSGFTKKRKYNPEKDRLQYKDLAWFGESKVDIKPNQRPELLN